MGQKLGAFLRVLGSGLSPQAFQANVGMYQQEKAQEAQIASEQRQEESAIKQMGVKQAFANLGVLGIAAKKANAEGDTEQSHRIGLAAKEIFDKIDPRYRGMAMDSFMTYTLQDEEDKKRGSTIALWKPGQPDTRTELRLEDKNVDTLMSQGYVKAPTQQIQAKPGELTKSQAGKIMLKGAEGRSALAKNVTEIDNLIKTVSSKDFIGGATGMATQGLNSAVTQVQQLFGGENLLNDDGSINESALEISQETASRLQRAAGQGGLAQSQTLQLAYILAKANDPSGRLSDRDVKTAEDMLGDTADPKVRAKILRDVQRRLISNYNIEQGSIAKSLGKAFKPITMKEIKSLAGTKEDLDDSPSSRILKKSGLM